jgi:predicted nucleotidyltransferase
MMVFGSKAREDASPDSDLDVLVVLRENKDLKSRIRLLGYDLALGKDVVPSIVVYTVQEIERRREHRSVFVESVEREGVMVS